MKNKSKFTPIQFFGLILLLFGLIFLTYGFVKFRMVRNWISTKGLIQSTQIKHFNSIGSHNSTYIIYQLEVNYIYYINGINGRKYQSKSIIDDKTQVSLLEVQKLQQQYNYGKKINVFFDPQNPENSELEICSKKKAIQIFIISGILLYGGPGCQDKFLKVFKIGFSSFDFMVLII